MQGRGIAVLTGSALATFWPGALAFGYPGVLGPYWREAFGVGTAATGNIMFFMLASLGVFMFLVGRLQERVGIRPTMALGGLICGLNMLTAAFAQSMPLIYAWAFITGAASCFTNMPALTLVQRWFPSRRGLVSGVVNLVFGLAAAITAPAIGRMLTGLGYLKTNLVIAIAAAATGILAAALAHEPTEAGSARGAGAAASERQFTVGQAIRTLDLWLIWLAWAFVGGGAIAMVTQSVGFGLSQGLALGSAVVILTAFNITNGLSRILSGYFSDRLPRTATMASVFGLAGIAYFLLPHTRGLVPAALLACLVGTALGTLFAVSAPLVADRFGVAHFGSIFGLVFTAYGFVAGPLGPWVGGLMLDYFPGSYVPVFTYLGLLCILGAVSISLVGRKLSRQNR